MSESKSTTPTEKSEQRNSDALSLIRRGRRSSTVTPRLDPLQPEKVQQGVRLITLDQIRDREKDTRIVRSEHVEQLIASIKVVGLITPLTVDRDFTLLAGAHRLAALKGLKEQDPEHFHHLFPRGEVPARVMPLSATTDQLLALRVEIEENEKRRDYTPQEVLDVARDLEAAGFSRARGRPASGERPLIPALEAIFGKSKATIKRYLSSAEHGETAPGQDESEWLEQLDKDRQTIIDKLGRLERNLRAQLALWKTPVEGVDDQTNELRREWVQELTTLRERIATERAVLQKRHG